MFLDITSLTINTDYEYLYIFKHELTTRTSRILPHFLMFLDITSLTINTDYEYLYIFKHELTTRTSA